MNRLPQYLRDNIPNLKSLQLVDSTNHQLVQLADLLIGSVYGDCTNVQSPVKRRLINTLKTAAGVHSLLEERHDAERKFCVDTWRPPKPHDRDR